MLISVGLCFASATRAASPIPKKIENPPSLPIVPASFESLLVIDDASGVTLYERNATSIHSGASLTKLMTARVFTSTPTNWEANGSILKSDEVGGGRLRVSSGSVMTLRDVLYSAIIGSANNAAMAMARMFDGKGMPAFIARMNATAKTLGLAQASYVEPSGMDAKNLISARDIATLINADSKDPEISRAMTSPTYSFVVKKPKLAKTIKNTNELLFTAPDVTVHAGKTGYIEESMYNFATRISPKGDPSKTVTVVVFGAPSRLESMTAAHQLANWAWSAYDWTASAGSAPTLARDLGVGDRGADVTALQKFLNTHEAVIAKSGPGSPGKETSLFGEMTRIALAKYQEAHRAEILTPHGAKTGYGYLDAVTRAYIQADAVGGMLAKK